MIGLSVAWFQILSNTSMVLTVMFSSYVLYKKRKATMKKTKKNKHEMTTEEKEDIKNHHY